MNFKSRIFLIVTGTALFLILSGIGLFLSINKPLWTDEIHTADIALVECSYGQIIKGVVSGEANNFPLYYLIQKAVMDITGYEFIQDWRGEHFLFDPAGQIILRLPSILFISLTLTLVLFIFIISKQPLTGVAGFLLTLSSYMTWAYWAEARPYALWYCLTLLHAALLWKSFSEKKLKIAPLTIIHWLLALTSILSLAQILTAAATAAILKKADWKKIPVLISPIPVILFYHFKGFSPRPILTGNALELLLIAVPPEWLLILLINLAFILRKPASRPDQTFYLLLAGMFFTAAAIIFMSFSNDISRQGALLHYRHFIFLTPYVIISLGSIFNNWWKNRSNGLLSSSNIILFLLTLTTINGTRTLLLLYEHIIFIF
ncbi:MAG: hypothetical protein AB1650_04955 [Candidatus Omnitrophota bacterium]